LGVLRDRVLDGAAIQRHHRVLDLNAGSGLLTWDALRRAPEGGVYALAADAQSGSALRQQARRLPEPERPLVLIGDPPEIPELLALRGDRDVRFDALVGRNVLTRRPDKGAVLALAADLLVPNGRLSLAEVVPRHTQRLNVLVNLDQLGTDLAQRVREAEENIYTDPNDPMVSWDADDLVAQCRAAGLEVLAAETEEQVSERRIGASDLERWFTNGGDERPSYAEHLLRVVTPAELAEVRALYESELADQTVHWRSTTLYLVTRVGEER
jgi:putative ATPase